MKIKRDIPGYEGRYCACSSGHIWSVEREIRTGRYNHLRKYGGKYLYESKSKPDQYPVVALCKEGIVKWFTVHSLIMLSFVGPRLEGKQINHIDGDKCNNVPENLEYCSQKENFIHAAQIGLVNQKGANNPNYRHGKSRDKEHINAMWNARRRRKQYEDIND